MKLLLIDDDNFDRMLFRQRLRLVAPDWQVVEAADVRDALAALATATFDMVVTDLMLPDGDGADVIQALAAAGAGQIVVLSGMPDDELRGLPCVTAAFDKNHFSAAQLLDLVRPTE